MSAVGTTGPPTASPLARIAGGQDRNPWDDGADVITTQISPPVRHAGSACPSIAAILASECGPNARAADTNNARPRSQGGKPCLRGLRVTVGTVVGLVAAGRSVREILALYPYLEEEDIREALAYAAWRVEEVEVPVRRPA